jgi:hypothetical protein
MSARKRKESVISGISSMDFTGSTYQIHTVITASHYNSVGKHENLVVDEVM